MITCPCRARGYLLLYVSRSCACRTRVIARHHPLTPPPVSTVQDMAADFAAVLILAVGNDYLPGISLGAPDFFRKKEVASKKATLSGLPAMWAAYRAMRATPRFHERYVRALLLHTHKHARTHVFVDLPRLSTHTPGMG